METPTIIVIKTIVTRRKTLLYKWPLLLEDKNYVDTHFKACLYLVISAIVNINIYPLFYSKLIKTEIKLINKHE